MANTTLYPDDDALVAETQPDSNYGSVALLVCRSDSDGNTRSFLKFDLSGLPADITITQATLRLNCYAISGLASPDTDVQARQVSDDSWAEGTVTWNSQKTYGDVEDTQECSVAWIEWDITDYVASEYSGDQTVSVCMRMVTEDYSSAGSQTSFRSKEYDSGSAKPELYIEYSTGVKIAVAMHHYSRINKVIRG